MHSFPLQTKKQNAGDHVMAIDFKGFGHEFKLRMRQSRNLFAPKFKVNFVRATGKTEPFYIDQTRWFRGKMIGPDTEGSIVRAHRTDHGIHATIHVAGELYRLQPLDRNDTRQARAPDHFNHVLYAHRHVRGEQDDHATCGFSDEEEGEEVVQKASQDDVTGKSDTSRNRRAASTVDYKNEPVGAAKTICQMHLVADHHFFDLKGSVLAATNAMIEMMDDVNSKYENTGLGADIAKPLSPNLHMYEHTLQFAVAQVTVFEANNGQGSNRYEAADIKNEDGSIYREYPWCTYFFVLLKLVSIHCNSVLRNKNVVSAGADVPKRGRKSLWPSHNNDPFCINQCLVCVCY
jgi:hypothetical protein